MANKLQVSLLKEGVKTWNAWRREHQGIIVDLRGADLRRVEIGGGVDLNAALLTEARLPQADMYGAFLAWADLRSADLQGVNWGRLPVRGQREPREPAG